jgi:hypothetical protein
MDEIAGAAATVRPDDSVIWITAEYLNSRGRLM